MRYDEYIRDTGGDAAVLFIHGILDSPRRFNMFLPYVPEEFSIYNILLPGHGGTAREYSESSIGQWREKIRIEAAHLFARYERVYIAAHSMGTLFAVRESLAPGRAGRCSLFLIDVPLKIAVEPVMTKRAFKMIYSSRESLDRETLATLDSCSVSLPKNPLRLIGFARRYLELFGEIRAVRKLLPELSAETVVFQSGRDELVSEKAAGYFRNMKNAELHIMERSGHFYWEQNEAEAMLLRFGEWLR